MKTLIKSAIIGLALAGVAQADTLTQNSTDTVTTETTTFTFNKFNSALGSLTAIDLIIQSSTLSGNLTYNRLSGTTNFSNLVAGLVIDGPILGLSDDYETTPYTYNRTPSGNFFTNLGNTSRLISVNGANQSLISNTPLTISIDSSAFSNYIGSSGTVGINFTLVPSQTATGGSFTISTANFLAATSTTLRYTYTTPGPSPVPEPGQVAASLLLLGGIGVYVFIKRRHQLPTST